MITLLAGWGTPADGGWGLHAFGCGPGAACGGELAVSLSSFSSSIVHCSIFLFHFPIHFFPVPISIFLFFRCSSSLVLQFVPFLFIFSCSNVLLLTFALLSISLSLSLLSLKVGKFIEFRKRMQFIEFRLRVQIFRSGSSLPPFCWFASLPRWMG